MLSSYLIVLPHMKPILGERRDIQTWDTKDLKYVAQQISEKVLQFINTDTDFPSLVKRVSHHDILLQLLSIRMGENI